MGHGAEDTAAVCAALERMAGGARVSGFRALIERPQSGDVGKSWPET